MKISSHNHLTDQEILDHFYIDHNNDWLGILLERYVLLLFGVCMKYLKNEDEAKDSVQQIFLKVITELHRYKVSYFRSWIYMVAKNHCLMQLRDRQGKNISPVNDGVITPEEEENSLSQHVEKEQLLDLMSMSMDELNPDQRLCLTLFYLEKKSYQEIADITRYSLMQVKSYIQNGKRNLKILLDKKLSKNV
ncbi:MAG: sigma-70 family RNA polymerase sigma factor [Bacteroidetes bacterium]|nr:MAG: sigma-70 family RNA polymerase sigma factor [Bacteroidota bacterium]